MAHDPTLTGAIKMQSAQRRKGITRDDNCKTCQHSEYAWGKIWCSKHRIDLGDEVEAKKQFHKCVKHDLYLRVR